MSEQYEHGQWVLDADGIAYQRCESQSCTHLPINDDGNYSWWCQQDRLHYYQSAPVEPLTPLFTAEQVAQQVARARAEALREAADEFDAIVSAGDVAAVAAPVPGEHGRSEAVAVRDEAQEDPSAWLRNRAAEIEAAAVAGRDTAEGGAMGDTPQSTAGADTAVIRARCDAATPGFWEAHGSEIWTYPEGGGPPTSCVAFLHPCDGEPERYHLPDAEFIAHARTDLPAVLDLCERQQREIDALTAENELLRQPMATFTEDGEAIPGWVPVDLTYLSELEGADRERDALAAALAKVTHDYKPCPPDRCEHLVRTVEHCTCLFEPGNPVHQRPDAVLAALGGGDTAPADQPTADQPTADVLLDRVTKAIEIIDEALDEGKHLIDVHDDIKEALWPSDEPADSGTDTSGGGP